MAIIHDPNAPYQFVIPADRDLPEDHPNRTIFELRHLTGREQTVVGDRVAAIGASLNGSATLLSDVGRLACVGWSRLSDPAGDVPFRSRQGTVLGLRINCCDADLWDSLPLVVRKAIGEHVVQACVSGLTEAQQKN
jgi:hypothetical protein